VLGELGLVLTGGGARAGYQVGVLKALAQILRTPTSPFHIITGSSAGAINGAALACEADDFSGGVQRLEETWLALTPDSVYRTDMPSLAGIGLRWFGTVAGGGAAGHGAINHLLDTAPLRALLQQKLRLSRLPGLFRSGALRAFAVSATNYLTGTAITFFDGKPEVEDWARSQRLGKRTELGVEHIMASSAIPLFFPPVRLEGAPYGDGSVRQSTPLSPAIHLGADRLIAISVRYPRSSEETADLNEARLGHALTLADISGVLLNAVFLDSIESDVERLTRINRTLSLIPENKLHEVPHALRTIPALVLQPSKDLGELASIQSAHFPALLRYLLNGLGAQHGRGSDLLSYLAFERRYVEQVLDLGFRDTLARAAEIQNFVGPRAAGPSAG
jgi:NTE family protein